MNATFEFFQAAGKIHYDGGTSETGRFIRKVKTYQHVNPLASAANFYLAFSQLASLSSYPMIKAEKVVTEDIRNN